MARNKADVQDFYQTIFLNGDFARMGTFFDGDEFIQHDARGGDGLSALGALMQQQAKQGIALKLGRSRRFWARGTSSWSPPAAQSLTNRWRTTICSVLQTERSPSTGTPYRTFLRRKRGRTRMISSKQAEHPQRNRYVPAG